MAIEGLWILLLVVGFLLLWLGFYFQTEILKTAGTAIISSGVFSAVATSRFFTKLYSSVMHDIVYGEEFLSTRSDLEAVWKRVSGVLCQQRFPNLKEKIDEKIIEDYLPKTREFYYTDVTRHYTVMSYSEDTNEITCKAHSELTLVPHSNADHIEYTHKYKSSGEAGNIISEEFRIDGKLIEEFPETDIIDRKSSGSTSVVSVRLSASEHKISRERVSTIPMCPEPFSKVTYSTYAEKVRLNASSQVDSVRIKLVDKDLFNSIDNNAERENRVSAENKLLIMPGQGHILLYSVDRRV